MKTNFESEIRCVSQYAPFLRLQIGKSVAFDERENASIKTCVQLTFASPYFDLSVGRVKKRVKTPLRRRVAYRNAVSSNGRAPVDCSKPQNEINEHPARRTCRCCCCWRTAGEMLIIQPAGMPVFRLSPITSYSVTHAIFIP